MRVQTLTLVLRVCNPINGSVHNENDTSIHFIFLGEKRRRKNNLDLRENFLILIFLNLILICRLLLTMSTSFRSNLVAKLCMSSKMSLCQQHILAFQLKCRCLPEEASQKEKASFFSLILTLRNLCLKVTAVPRWLLYFR